MSSGWGSEKHYQLWVQLGEAEDTLREVSDWAMSRHSNYRNLIQKLWEAQDAVSELRGAVKSVEVGNWGNDK